MTLLLRLTLLSDGALASGEGRAATVDREILHDSDGLPRLSGRTAKGLLREAYTEVLEWRHMSKLDMGTVVGTRELFGEPGNADSGWLSVPDLRIPESDAVRLQIRAARSAGAALDPEAVLRTFTTIRAQTALVRDSGVARKNTLRTTRLLRRGTVLEARPRLSVDRESEESATSSLALACLALRRIGTSRSRGLGRCHVRLLDDDLDLTERQRQSLGAQ